MRSVTIQKQELTMNARAIASIVGVTVLSAQVAAAQVNPEENIPRTEYRIHGQSCTSTSPGLTPGYSQYGVYAPGMTAINVTCPLFVHTSWQPKDSTGAAHLLAPRLPPYRPYTSAIMLIGGYSRIAADPVRCTLANTALLGGQRVAATAAIPFKNGSGSVGAASLAPALSTTYQFDGWMFVTCRLPPRSALGFSHLTTISVQVKY
jgi:hypothetical protein